MSNAQWTVLVIAGLIALIVLGAQGGKLPFAIRAKEVLQAMFSGPGTGTSTSTGSTGG